MFLPLKISPIPKRDLGELTQALLMTLPTDIILDGKYLVWKKAQKKDQALQGLTNSYYCNNGTIELLDIKLNSRKKIGQNIPLIPETIQLNLTGYQRERHGQSFKEESERFQNRGYEITEGIIELPTAEGDTIIIDERGAIFLSVHRAPEIIKRWFAETQKVYQQ